MALFRFSGFPNQITDPERDFVVTVKPGNRGGEIILTRLPQSVTANQVSTDGGITWMSIGSFDNIQEYFPTRGWLFFNKQTSGRDFTQMYLRRDSGFAFELEELNSNTLRLIMFWGNDQGILSDEIQVNSLSQYPLTYSEVSPILDLFRNNPDIVESVLTFNYWVRVTRDSAGRTFISDAKGNPVDWNFIAPVVSNRTYGLEWVTEETYEYGSAGIGWRAPNGAYVFTNPNHNIPEWVRVNRTATLTYDEKKWIEESLKNGDK